MQKRFTENQIVSAIKKQEAGIAVKEICRELGISDATFYNWKAKYGGMEASDVKRMKELEAENAQLKSMYAETSMENRALKNLIEKKLWRLRRNGKQLNILLKKSNSVTARRVNWWEYPEPPVSIKRN